ncbi:hypothetical protein [Candidatus Ferrigenium straubiae]|jgi:hypothetical protein|uniref:hypothetical protein n=1 Tax=Candidatus Ferrigenium straubiae TaxID=2919506 RepID=UPI003F4AB0FE
MGTVSMDMSSYEIERDDASGYGEEVLCAGWVPALALHQPREEHQSMPADLAAIDVEAFLRKMYTCQR